MKVAALSERVVDRAEEAGAVGIEKELGPIVLSAASAGVSQGADGSHVRRSVARALWGLAARGPYARKARKVLERWASDVDDQVRYEAVREIHLLGQADPARFERMLSRIERLEGNDLVWGGSGSAMNALQQSHPGRVRDHALRALKSVTDERIRAIFVNQLTTLAVGGGDAVAGATLAAIAITPGSADAASLALCLAPFLEFDFDPADVVSLRAQRLGEALSQSARLALEDWRSKPAPRDKDVGRAFAEVLDALARPLARFVEDLMALALPATERRSRLARFFERVGKILDDAAATGEAGLVHHVVETLPARRLLDPRRAFLVAADLVRSGARSGYQFDSLGADAIVAFLERYLADHRALLQDDIECRKALFEILDIFVRAGWENARRITYGLDEIFR